MKTLYDLFKESETFDITFPHAALELEGMNTKDVSLSGKIIRVHKPYMVIQNTADYEIIDVPSEDDDCDIIFIKLRNGTLITFYN